MQTTTTPAGIEERPDRVLGRFRGHRDGPTLVVVGGMHGNEPAGRNAARRVVETLQRRGGIRRGGFMALAGNTRALEAGTRFIDTDLNRIWLPAANPDRPTAAEDVERRELERQVLQAMQAARGTVYVLDLHSTSNDGAPFATIGDTLRNRDFATRFPVPIVLGLEEELRGTMLEYFSEMGCVTLGFEAGQHDRPETVDHHEALIWVALAAAGLIDDGIDVSRYRRLLATSCRPCPRFFEILYRHVLLRGDGFRMDPGYVNFQRVRRGQALGTDQDGIVRAPVSGLLLMPLYQNMGEDAFFIGRPVRRSWLWLSRWLRRSGAERLLQRLPGVRRHEVPYRLITNTRSSRFYPLTLFNLFGYRRREQQGATLVVSRRRHDG